MLCPVVSPPPLEAPVVPGFRTLQPNVVPVTLPVRTISVWSPVGNTGLLLVNEISGLGYTMTVVGMGAPLLQPFIFGVIV